MSFPQGDSWLPETPVEALGPTVRELVTIEGRSFVVTRPDGVERLTEHPELGGPRASDEYQPYWAHLWPAARMLATAVLQEPWPPGPLDALEIGCGLGLPGLAALARGLRVTFSDYDATALRFAADNARLNGFTNFQVRTLDVRRPTHDGRVAVLLISDILYEQSLAEPLAELIVRLLAPGGLCLLTDQDRLPAQALREGLAKRGVNFSLSTMTATTAGRTVEGTLYRIAHG